MKKIKEETMKIFGDEMQKFKKETEKTILCNVTSVAK